jgi:hypothetical protein
MAVSQISKIQVRVGKQEDLPLLSAGEFGFATDTNQLYIGKPGATTAEENVEILTALSPIPTVGNDNEVLFNDFGSYSGSSNFTYDSLTSNLTIKGKILLDKVASTAMGIEMGTSALSSTLTSKALVIGTNIKVDNSTDSILSSNSASCYRTMIRMNGSDNSGIQFFTSSTAQTVANNGVVTLAESVRITGSGFLSVNTDNPGGPLGVKTNNDSLLRIANNTSISSTGEGVVIDAANLALTGTQPLTIRSTSLSIRVGSTSDKVLNVTSDKKIGILTDSPTATLHVNGSFAATSKSFYIPHPTKENMSLQHGSLEGPENGVYHRGICKDHFIKLPDYWKGLVDESTITVSLTPIGKYQKLYVDRITKDAVFVWGEDVQSTSDINCFFVIWAERKDIPKLQVEIINS